MKIFHNYKGQDKIISIHLMVSQKLIKVLLKSVDYYPVDINSKNLNKMENLKRND